jgi:hypothetical protein
VVITDSKAIKGNFLNLSEEMYEMIEYSNHSNGGPTPISRSIGSLSAFSPVKAKKTVTFGGQVKEEAVVDDGLKKDTIQILQEVPESFNQETGVWSNTPRPLDLMSRFVGKGFGLAVDADKKDRQTRETEPQYPKNFDIEKDSRFEK